STYARQSITPPPCRWATQPGRTHTGDGETTPNPSSHAYPERCGTPDHSVDTVALEANASRSQSPTPSLATPSCGLLVGGPDHTAAPAQGRIHKLPPVRGVSRPFRQWPHVPILTNWLATHGFAGQSICQVGFAHFVAPAVREIPHRDCKQPHPSSLSVGELLKVFGLVVLGESGGTTITRSLLSPRKQSGKRPRDPPTPQAQSNTATGPRHGRHRTSSSRRSAEAHPRTDGSPPAKPSTRSRRHARSAQPAWRRHSRSCVPRSSCRWVHRSGRSTCSLSAPFCWLPDTESRPHLRTGTEMPGVLVVTPAVAQPMTTHHSGAVTMWAVGVSHSLAPFRVLDQRTFPSMLHERIDRRF